jgi:hypothetical protein
MGEILSKTTMICLQYDKSNDNFDMISNVDSDDSLVYSDDTIYNGDEIIFKYYEEREPSITEQLAREFLTYMRNFMTR